MDLKKESLGRYEVVEVFEQGSFSKAFTNYFLKVWDNNNQVFLIFSCVICDAVYKSDKIIAKELIKIFTNQLRALIKENNV